MTQGTESEKRTQPVLRNLAIASVVFLTIAVVGLSWDYSSKRPLLSSERAELDELILLTMTSRQIEKAVLV